MPSSPKPKHQAVFGRNRITVTSPKTEGHAGGETRVIPLFPELRPHLEAAKVEAASDAEFIVTDRYRHPDSYGRKGLNLGTQFKRIIRRAGIEPWPRVWHNLRASRQTELAERFPLHVVCEWLGNTTTVATQHYLSVRDSDYENALKPAEETAKQVAQNPARNPAMQAAATARTERQR